MTAQHITVAGDILTPLNVALIIEVYEAACRVD